MTIKELETKLDIPRATIRFYEKEGLISPKREENGYRDYSEEDLERIKKIIVLRKVGLPVSDISDVFDGAVSLSEAIDRNSENLRKQLEELQGSLHLSQKIRESDKGIFDLDADEYLNYIVTEEKAGNRFVSIATDIAKEEKRVFAHYFSAVDRDGNPYDSWGKILFNALIVMAVTGGILCLYRRSLTLKNFVAGAVGVFCVILLEAVLSIPLYFLGKKIPWIARNRAKCLFFLALFLCLILLLITILLQL
ncbi:MAG: MerR family transcriptional regulator [Lachnospiraceae bacterium]|nr:MerR family transcriptional regulator [Lachnospiraceae bacterium]